MDTLCGLQCRASGTGHLPRSGSRDRWWLGFLAWLPTVAPGFWPVVPEVPQPTRIPARATQAPSANRHVRRFISPPLNPRVHSAPSIEGKRHVTGPRHQKRSYLLIKPPGTRAPATVHPVPSVGHGGRPVRAGTGPPGPSVTAARPDRASCSRPSSIPMSPRWLHRRKLTRAAGHSDRSRSGETAAFG